VDQFSDNLDRREVDGGGYAGDGDQVKQDEDVDCGATKGTVFAILHIDKFTSIEVQPFKPLPVFRSGTMKA
jgi:hypothetical protein